MEVRRFDDCAGAIHRILRRIEQTTSAAIGKCDFDGKIYTAITGKMLGVTMKREVLEQADKRLVDRLRGLNPKISDKDFEFISNRFAGTETAKHRRKEPYFWPFMGSKLWGHALMVDFFTEPDELHAYWKTFPDEKQFKRDMCYFMGVLYDESLPDLLPPTYILDVKAKCAEIYGMYTRVMKELTELRDIEDDMRRKQGRGDVLLDSNVYRTDEIELCRDIIDEHDSAMALLDEICSSQPQPREALMYMDVAGEKDDEETERYISLVDKYKQSIDVMATSFMRMIAELVSMARQPGYPPEAAREAGVDIHKLHMLIILLPHIFETKDTTFPAVAKKYSRITKVYPDVSPDTMYGACILVQFFTETHIDMIIAALRKKLAATASALL